MYANAVLSTSSPSDLLQLRDKSLFSSGVPARMRKHPQQERSIQMVSAIREAAILAFRDRGDGRQASMQEVALRAGASLGSVYQYYANMESLIAAIYEDVIIDSLLKAPITARSKDCSGSDLSSRVQQLDRLFGTSLGQDFYIPAINEHREGNNLMRLLLSNLRSCVLADHYSAVWRSAVDHSE